MDALLNEDWTAEVVGRMHAQKGVMGNDRVLAGKGGGLTPCTLKIRSGCEGGGKGALIQEDKSATLSTLQDQTLFQPMDVDCRNGALNETATPVQARMSNTLNAGGVVACMATQQGGAEIRTDDMAPTLTAAAGMSGNNQPVICIQDLKETAPCSMSIHYSVDNTTDFVTYNDINGRGKKCEACSGCTWYGLCKPQALPTNGTRIYISGAITGTVNYMERFAEAEKLLEKKGYTVINPAKINAQLPLSTSYEEYMRIDAIMQSIEDGSLMLNIGDVIPCVLSDGQRVHFEVTAIDDEGYRLEMKELLKCMAHTDLHRWYDALYTTGLPKVLRDAIVSTRRKYKENGDGDIKELDSLIFAPSASEVFSKEEFEDNEWLGDKDVYEQLDFYKDWRNRIRCTVEDGKPNAWWLLSARAGHSTTFARVSYYGDCYSYSATSTWIAAPVCFRIRKSK